MNRWIGAALAIGACLSRPALAQVSTDWPRMAEIEARFLIATDAKRNEFSVPLLDTTGRVRYTFACKGGQVEFTDELANRTGMQFPGLLTCVLNEGTAIVEGSLLAEDAVAIWHTRGAWWDDTTLLGKCGDYPEFGRVRHFRLRGFVLALEATDLVLKDGELRFFTFVVSLKRDATANGAVAERPGYLYPAGQCADVKIGKEPRSCRDRDWLLVPCIEGDNRPRGS